MAKDEKPVLADQEIELKQLLKRLDMLDQRLDNLDSIVTAVVERVMKQPLAFSFTCPRCGHSVEIGLMGTEKPKK